MLRPMEHVAPSAAPDTSPDETKRTSLGTPTDTFTVRNALPTLTAKQKYDAYMRDHRRQLRQLEKEARGEMSPSGEWYSER